jgi:hypothetical protein
MRTGIGVVVIVASGVLGGVVALVLRTRLRAAASDALLALAGAGLGVGGLLVQGDATGASWVLAPAILAVLVPVHVRLLFARGGPFRT